MIDFVIICHPGELALKSLLLVWSLKKHANGNYKIHIALPSETSSATNNYKNTLASLEELGCQFFTFENKYLSQNKPLLQGDKTSNKIYALKAFKGQNTTVFLDSDILAISNFNVSELAQYLPIGLKTANRYHAINWKKLYAHFSISFPSTTVTTRIDKKKTPPYYNSGVIVLAKNNYKAIIDAWELFFKNLSKASLEKHDDYPIFFRDQIALALALQKLEQKVCLLNEQFNSPVFSSKQLIKNKAHLVHYHIPIEIAGNKLLFNSFAQFKNKYFWSIDMGGEKWASLLERGKIRMWIQVFYYKLAVQNYLLKKRLSR